jgi:hypothetical protein
VTFGSHRDTQLAKDVNGGATVPRPGPVRGKGTLGTDREAVWHWRVLLGMTWAALPLWPLTAAQAHA